MKLKALSVGCMETNGYIVSDEISNEGIVIDPGAEAYRFMRYIDENSINLRAVLLTHSHYDHIGACEEIRNKYDVPVMICENEEEVISNETNNLSAMLSEKPIVLKYDRVLKDGEKYSFGSLELVTINTPGHTPGSACYYFEKEGVLFSGDTLFCMSVGRTDFPLGSSEKIIESLGKLSALPDYVKVYPGHNMPTSIGQEKRMNPYMNQGL